jgi:hypothetical protein
MNMSCNAFEPLPTVTAVSIKVVTLPTLASPKLSQRSPIASKNFTSEQVKSCP